MRSAKWLIGILALVLVVAVVFFLPTPAEAATVTASGSCGENVTYTLDDAGTLIITGTGPMTSWNWFNAPWYENTEIKKVIIEEGVTTIPSYTFCFCENLASVSIPDTVTSIGHCAFQGCVRLGELVIPDSVVTLGNAAFSECSALQKITLSNNLTALGEKTFQGCTSLKSVVIPDSVQSLGDAFWNCISLEELTIPKVGTHLGLILGNPSNNMNEDLDETAEFAEYEFVNQWGVTQRYRFFMPPNLKTVTITGGTLQAKSLSGYTAMETLILGENVTQIQDDAFSNCSLDAVLFCGNKPEISGNAFRGVTAQVYTLKNWQGSQYGGNLTWKGDADAVEYQIAEDARRFYGIGEALEIPRILAVHRFGQKQISLPAEGTITLGAYDNSQPGNKTVQVSFAGKPLEYSYIVVDPEKVCAEVPETVVFNGTDGEVIPRLTYEGIPMTYGPDYNVVYRENTYTSDGAQVIITGVRAFEGWSLTETFSVLKADLSNAVVTAKDRQYTGEPVSGLSKVTWNGLELQDTDFRAVYKDNITTGTATVYILGTGNFTGMASATFQVTAPPSSTTVSYSASSATVTGGMYVDMGGDTYCGYQVYQGGKQVSFSPGHVTDSLHVSFPGPGTYSVEIFTQDITYVVQGGQTVAKPIGTQRWKTMSVQVVPGPGKMEAPEDLTPLVPEQVDFRRMHLQVAYTPVNANIYPLVWKSSNPSVASVESGILTLHKAGKTTVTATINGVTATWEMDIAPLDIQQDTRIIYNAADKTVVVICQGEVLTPDVDYTVSLTNEGEYDQLVITGKGLFTGSIKKRFTPGTDEPYCLGDLNEDLVVNTDDVVALVLYLTMPDMFTIDGPADFNNDGDLTTEDAIALLLHITMPDLFPLG